MYNTGVLLVPEEESTTQSHHRIPKPDDSDIIVLNIGGQRFETAKGTLRNHPKSKLARLNKTSEEYDPVKEEYFFDRNPVMFEWILDYYRYGLMHMPMDVCVNKVTEELEFWELLATETIAGGCRQKYREMMHEYTTYLALKKEFEHDLNVEKPQAVEISALQKFREKIWMFLDNIESSWPAKVWGVIYYSLIILSVFAVFFGTMKGFRVPRNTHIFLPSNDTAANNDTIDKSSKIYRLITTQPHSALRFLDNGLMFIFTADFIMCLLVTPSLKLMFSIMYICDLMYLIPAWCRFIIDMVDITVWLKDSGVQLLLAMDMLMVFRVLRIFVLARYYRGLRVILLALKACLGELVLLMLFVLFSLTIYACCIYSAELYNDFAFDNIFIGLYWGLITMATVGYGDVVPRTAVGYIVTVTCAMAGVIIVGMVIPLFSGNFTLYYRYRDAGLGHLEKRCSKHVLPKETARPARKNVDLHGEILLKVEKYKEKNSIYIKSGEYNNDININEDPTDDMCTDLGPDGYTGSSSSLPDCVSIK